MTSFDLAIGRGTLRQLHASLANHAPDQAVTILQEAGYAAGEAIYKAFASWLPERTGVDSPGNLDAGLLAENIGPNGEIVVMRDADHAFSGREEQLAQLIAEWVLA